MRGDAVNMGIGQGDVQVTPLQMANIYAAIGNGGTLYRPTLVDRIGAGGGAPEEPYPVEVLGELPLSPQNIAIMQDSLWKVANDPNGTAVDKFEGLPFQVAGKTGTAEAPPRNSHAWVCWLRSGQPARNSHRRYFGARGRRFGRFCPALPPASSSCTLASPPLHPSPGSELANRYGWQINSEVGLRLNQDAVNCG